MKHNNSRFLYLLLVLVPALFCCCSAEPLLDDSTSPVSGRPLQLGELSNVTFGGSVSSIEEITTRGIPTGKQSVLHDFTNHELEGKEGGRAGWISGEVRTQYDEDIKRAATRSFDASKQLFGKNSRFRMLVFVGPYGGSVDMSKPVANMVCQVNAAGNGASFVSPATTLGLLKGRYTFVCFPADEKYNTWQVGKSTGNQIQIGKDEDFVCMKYADINVNSSTTAIPLNQFTRYGYQLTVKFSVNEDLGYLLFPQDELVLEVSDGGSGETNRVINTGGTFDLQSKSLNYNTNTGSFKDTLKISGSGMSQSFSSVSNFLIANDGASQKLSIKYPQLTVLKPKDTDGNAPNAEDSVFTIKGGTYTTSEAVKFEAGKSYSITLAVGEQVKGYIVGGVLWSPGNLDYNSSTKQFFWAPTPDKAKNAREGRGAWFRWMSALPQSSSNTSSSNPTSQSWSVTTPNWSSNSKDLGNYKGYYKNYTITSTVSQGQSLSASTLGDPCTAMGPGWRMPTYNEIYLLCYVSPNATPSGTFTTGRNRFENFSAYSASFTDNVTTEAARFAGIFFTQSSKPNDNPSAITSRAQYNGSQLFLPAAGYSDGSSVNYPGTYGYYWSSTPRSGYTYYSWAVYFYSGYLSPDYNGRNYGFSVRCVFGE